jgi:hypothetical protein
MKYLAVIIICLATMACTKGAPDHYEFYVGSDVPPEDTKYILQAIYDWNQCGVITISLTTSDYPESIPISYTEAIPGADPREAGIALSVNYNCVGCISPATHILYDHRGNVPPQNFPAEYTVTVISHEMGHVFGLPHFGKDDELMHAETSPNARVSQEDCDMVAYIHNKLSL